MGEIARLSETSRERCWAHSSHCCFEFDRSAQALSERIGTEMDRLALVSTTDDERDDIFMIYPGRFAKMNRLSDQVGPGTCPCMTSGQ